MCPYVKSPLYIINNYMPKYRIDIFKYWKVQERKDEIVR